MKINNKTIAEESIPFLIAEAGVNYYDIAVKEEISPLKAAKLMIREAAKAGADAIKFQTYKAEKLVVKDSPAYWDTTKELTKSQYELFKKYDHFGEIEYVELSNYAKGNGIIFMSTPFDNEAVEYLNELMPVFKIASADITNFPLIERIAKKKKPIILSVGAATIEEIREAVSVIEHSGNHEIIIMHCVLNYPTQYQNANLLVIQHLQKIFPKYLIGYSDHTAPDPQMLVLVSAYVLGARVIEKHFTLDKGLAGNDHYHAMDTQDLTNALINLKFAKMILGNKEKTIQDELTARKYARRSIVAAIDITKGTKITQDMLICKRPGTGISPKLENSVIGKTAKINIKVDEILSWEQIE